MKRLRVYSFRITYQQEASLIKPLTRLLRQYCFPLDDKIDLILTTSLIITQIKTKTT